VPWYISCWSFQSLEPCAAAANEALPLHKNEEREMVQTAAGADSTKNGRTMKNKFHNE